MTTTQREAIERHGRNVLAIFPNATERNPVALYKKLRRFDARAAAVAVSLCNGTTDQDAADAAFERVLAAANKLLGNAYDNRPTTGAACGCKRGAQRDNCQACEGTGKVIDFAAIRARKPLVPVFVNRDPRGYALKIEDEYVRANGLQIHRDWGGYGILAPEIDG